MAIRTIFLVVIAVVLSACGNTTTYSTVQGETLLGRTAARALAPVVQATACPNGYHLKQEMEYTRNEPRADLRVTEYHRLGTAVYAGGRISSSGHKSGYVWAGDVYEVSHSRVSRPNRQTEGYVAHIRC